MTTPKLPPAAAQCPEQVRLAFGVGGDEGAVGEHDVRGEQVVQGEPEPAAQRPVPAAERQARHAHGPGGAGRGGQAERLRGAYDVGGRRPTRDVGDLRLRVHGHLPHTGQIDGEAAVAERSSRPVVAAAAHRQRHPGLARGPYGGLDVGVIAAPDDDAGPG
ncbi:hypothetical protein GCM10020001_109020 [Nonomuraea salmonea]